MEPEEEHFALILKYLDNELSEEELAVFERLRSENPEYRQQIEDLSLMTSAIKADKRHEDYQEIESIFEEFKSESSTPEEGRQVFSNWWIGIAAAISLFVVSYFAFFTTDRVSGEELFTQYHTPLAISATVRDGSTNDKAIQLYNSKEYDQAIPFLLQSQSEEKFELTPILLAISYIETEKYDNAISTLRNLSVGADQLILGQHRDWYLSMVLLRQGKIKDATLLLKGLSESAGPYKQKAADITKQLE